MKITVPYARLGAGVLGGVLLLGGAGAAMAAEVENDEVDVNVNIESVGALTMTVAADSTALTEVAEADEDYRTFTGALPTVTVSDTRGEIPSGAGWYVLGQSSDFGTSPASDVIGADRLGWTPALVGGDAGEVAPGDGTVPSVDAPTQPGNNVGLEGEELLALALDSGDAAAVGSWSVNAPLLLKADADVAPGAYAATITLSLWEDVVAP